jgi:CubicO group peptidase (beta-lactamase class C family)
MRAGRTAARFALAAVAAAGLAASACAQTPERAGGYGAALAPATAFDVAGFRAYAEAARAADGAPGVAIALVLPGGGAELVTLGVRSVETGLPVDADTVFSIGSLTKAFAAATVATTVDRDGADWSDPVDRWFPALELHDESLRDVFDLRDMLSGRYGTRLSDEVFFRAVTADKGEYLAFTGRLPPADGFRDCFVYSNAMYTTSGEVVRGVTGRPWDEIVAARIFQPLGMTRSSTDDAALLNEPNRSEHHLPRGPGGAMTVLPWGPYGREIGGASGDVQSTARDMAKWLRMLLDGGRSGGETILSADAMRQIFSPQTSLCPGESERWVRIARAAGLQAEPMGYGFGWYLHAYRGHKLAHHSGGQGGFISYAALLPERGFGVAVMVNGRANRGLAQALAFRAVDAALGTPTLDWAKQMAPPPGAAAGGSIVSLSPADQAARRPDLPMTAAPEAYAGIYASDVIPQGLSVTLENGALRARLGLLDATLTHWHADTFLMTAAGRLETPYEDLMTFRFDGRRNVVGVDAQRTVALQGLTRLP